MYANNEFTIQIFKKGIVELTSCPFTKKNFVKRKGQYYG